MEQSKVPVNITYRKTGTSPPIFIAGSFSDPQWQLQEMDHSIDGDGEHTFKAQVMAEPGKEYQFKLRIGEGDWWILSDNYPTVTDDSGNQNNLLTAPRPSNDPSTRGTDKGKAVDGSGKKQSQTSSKPEIIVATTDDSMGDADNLKTPLFAHECLGAYEFADTSDHEEEQEQSRRSSRPKSKDFDVDFDVNDPTIEQFPSDRTSIMDALRNIQTHLSEDQTHLDDIPSSPRVVSSRRTSIDSIDETSLSPAILSPTTSRRRDGRLSHSSAGRNRSAASLGSIAEEPKPASQGDQKTQRIQPPEAKTKPTVADVKSPRSEDDEGVAMTTSEVTPNNQADEISPAQIKSIESKRNAPVNSESVQDEGGSAGMEAGSTVELDGSAAGVTSESADNASSRVSQPKQDSTSQETQIHRPSRSDSGKSPAKRSTADVSIFRSLFSTLLGSKSNIYRILTTGVAALAIGIGCWKVIDKQVNKSGLL